MKTAQENLVELSNLIIEASIVWTGADEEKNPLLKKIRTLAGIHIQGNKLIQENGRFLEGPSLDLPVCPRCGYHSEFLCYRGSEAWHRCQRCGLKYTNKVEKQ